MKNFNMKRFGHVLSYTFLTSRRNLLSGMIGMLLCYLFMFVVSNMNYHSSLPGTLSIVNQAMGMSTMATLIFIVVATGTLFRPEESRQGRTALMMLPASNLEKFVGRWVYLLVFTLAGVLMFVVADGLHYAFHSLKGHDAVSAVGCLLRLGDVRYVSAHQEAMEHLSRVDIGLMFLALHAYFLLASTLVRRHTVVIAAAVLALLAVGWYWLIENAVSHSLTAEQTLWGVFVVAILLIVGFTWLAYCSFCRWQLITRKFLSL